MRKPIAKAPARPGRLWVLPVVFLSGFVLAYVLFASSSSSSSSQAGDEGPTTREPRDGCEFELAGFSTCVDAVVAQAQASGQSRIDIGSCQTLHGKDLTKCIQSWRESVVQHRPNSFSRITQTRVGPMLFNVNDMFVGRSLKRYGEWSGLEGVQIYSQEIKRGDVVLDIGANIGAMAMVFSAITGPKGLVLAFEAEYQNYIHLCTNIGLQERYNIHPRFEAVGKASGRLAVQKMPPDRVLNFGGHSLLNPNIVKPSGSVSDTDRDYIEVPVVAIDDLKLDRVDFCKLDIQGMEMDVLEGARKTLEKFHPKIYMENELRPGQTDIYREFLHKLGYECTDHSVPLFNPENFKGEKENIFDPALADPADHKVLELQDYNLRDEGVELLGPVLANEAKVETMGLELNKIGNVGAKLLCQMLQSNTTVRKLHLGFNSIGDKGAVALAMLLEKTTTLIRLDVAQNKISDKGAAAIGQALAHTVSLRSLDMRHNSKMTEKGILALAQGLETNTSVVKWSVALNRSFGKKHLDPLRSSLEKNVYLVEIDCPADTDDIVKRNRLLGAKWNRSIITWMWLQKHLLVKLPRNIALMIAQEIWRMRTRAEHG